MTTFSKGQKVRVTDTYPNTTETVDPSDAALIGQVGTVVGRRSGWYEVNLESEEGVTYPLALFFPEELEAV